MSIQDKQAFSGDSPVVEGAWPKQQPTRDRNRFLFFGLGEASTEVEDQDDEEWNIPGMIRVQFFKDHCQQSGSSHVSIFKLKFSEPLMRWLLEFNKFSLFEW